MATKGLIIYCVNGDGEPSAYFGRQQDAMKDAQHRSESCDEPVTVERCVTAPITKEIVVRLASGGGRFIDQAETIASFVRGKRQ